jgi:hypothetical protein
MSMISSFKYAFTSQYAQRNNLHSIIHEKERLSRGVNACLNELIMTMGYVSVVDKKLGASSIVILIKSLSNISTNCSCCCCNLDSPA